LLYSRDVATPTTATYSMIMKSLHLWCVTSDYIVASGQLCQLSTLSPL